VQRAGDVVMVPELWSHGILNLDDTVSVATETHASIFRPRLPLAYGRLQRFAFEEPEGEA
jgi:dTDP-4-dehydrorhamnose 3,5-epimerase-like enzyme